MDDFAVAARGFRPGGGVPLEEEGAVRRVGGQMGGDGEADGAGADDLVRGGFVSRGG